MDETKKKILLEILNERLYKDSAIDKNIHDKILQLIWK